MSKDEQDDMEYFFKNMYRSLGMPKRAIDIKTAINNSLLAHERKERKELERKFPNTEERIANIKEHLGIADGKQNTN